MKSLYKFAGMNVDSDISAGDALGKAVGAKVINRAKVDGMSAANSKKVGEFAVARGKVDGSGL